MKVLLMLGPNDGQMLEIQEKYLPTMKFPVFNRDVSCEKYISSSDYVPISETTTVTYILELPLNPTPEGYNRMWFDG